MSENREMTVHERIEAEARMRESARTPFIGGGGAGRIAPLPNWKAATLSELLGEQASILDALERAAGILTERLLPITLQEPVPSTAEKAPEAPYAPLAEVVLRHNERLAHLASRLNQQIDRLSL